jgi:hypothetical protein
MGGAVKAVTQPVTKAVKTVVGGASKTANELVGNKPEAAAAAPAAAPAAEATKLMSLDPKSRPVAGAAPAAEAPGKYSDPNKEKAYQDWLKSQPGK